MVEEGGGYHPDCIHPERINHRRPTLYFPPQIDALTPTSSFLHHRCPRNCSPALDLLHPDEPHPPAPSPILRPLPQPDRHTWLPSILTSLFSDRLATTRKPGLLPSDTTSPFPSS